MYFEDLTSYEYGGQEPDPNVVNVGWLSCDHPFESGDVPAQFADAVRELVAAPLNLYRGSHLCEYCPKPPVIVRNGMKWIDPPAGTSGNGEIRVTAENGVTYVAPVLVLHYIEAHRYRPPQEFMMAVLAKRGAA
jgi:hypothetical protein